MHLEACIPRHVAEPRDAVVVKLFGDIPYQKQSAAALQDDA